MVQCLRVVRGACSDKSNTARALHAINATFGRQARALPTILVAAVIQGWSLYGLHHAIKSHVWPATQQRWLLGFYAVAALVPITVQLLADHARAAATWLLVAAMGIALFYFGWHYGSAVADDAADRFASSGEYLPLAFVLLVLSLHVLPFVQSRLAAGRWSAEYRALFGTIAAPHRFTIFDSIPDDMEGKDSKS